MQDYPEGVLMPMHIANWLVERVLDFAGQNPEHLRCVYHEGPESPAGPIIGGKTQDEDPGFDTRRVPEGDDHPHTGEVGQLLQVWAEAPSI